MLTELSYAPVVETIAEKLIFQHHSHLAEAKIQYLFRTGTWMSKGKVVWGMAYKVPVREHFNTACDFAIVINVGEWKGLTPEQKTALVDHELCHCGCTEDKDGNRKWAIWPHDVMEFRAVINRHGLWEPEVKRFGELAARKINQLNLFDNSRPADLSAEADKEPVASGAERVS